MTTRLQASEVWPSRLVMLEVDQIGLLDDDEIELDLAALALSELDHDGIELGPYLALLDEVADRLSTVGEGAQTVSQQAEVLAQVLHAEFGFVGDAASYDAPLNADFIRVLDRKLGLPVSLSILYVSAARRLGWKAYALNMPGHVLVRIGDDPFIVIDPFNGGIPVDEDQLSALVRQFMGPGAKLAPEYLRPVPNRTTLVRLLINQATRAEQGADQLRALTMYTRMTQVAPHHPDGWWELARMQLQLQNIDAARHSLSAMLEVTRDPERRKLVVAALEAIAGG
ncbi:MAG: transglutaminase-like domain-containing protein [Novosphingobium sp.]|nr:transglutaminase-like domain-containing protein [Novosphingobium sp.]